MKAILTIILLMGISTYAQNQENQESPGPGSYEILTTEKGPVIIPFRMHRGKPLLDLEINGEKATLMIDNGILWDQTWLFGSPLVKKLNLRPLEEVSIGGAGEGDPTQSFTSGNLELRFRDIVFREQPSLVSPPAAGFTGMFPGADGQLCNTFFKHFIVEFDFINRLILLHKPGDFQYKGKGSILEMRQNDSGTHAVPFSFTMLNGKKYSDWVDIDFGGIYPLKIALNSKHQIELPKEHSETQSYGAQGKSSEYRANIQSMTIGDYNFEEVNAVFGDEGTSRIHPNNLGVIGLPLFMKFNTIFDYFNYKIYLDPNENFNKPF